MARSFRLAALLGLLTLGCAPKTDSTAAPAPAAAAAPAPTAAPDPAAAPEPVAAPVRVLVTGFNDWKDLGDPPNVWRCRDNPSCRLVLGDPETERPTDLDGPLVRTLTERIPEGEVQFTFATMPVTWGAFESLDRAEHDVIVNLGLGVYDNTHTLLVERGAYNHRKGKDAAGAPQDAKIDPALGETLQPPADSPIPERVAKLADQRIEGYDVKVAEARATNSYLCNETHFRALKALEASRAGGGELQAVYFVHIPYAENGDFDRLARGVAGVVEQLVR